MSSQKQPTLDASVGSLRSSRNKLISIKARNRLMSKSTSSKVWVLSIKVQRQFLFSSIEKANTYFSTSHCVHEQPLITIEKKGRLVGFLLYFFLITYTFIIFFGSSLILPKDERDWCLAARLGYPGIDTAYENPDFPTNPCLRERSIWLLYINLDECDMARRLACSVLFGAAIGYVTKHKIEQYNCPFKIDVWLSYGMQRFFILTASNGKLQNVQPV